MNRVILTGRLTKELTLTSTSNGKFYTAGDIACKRTPEGTDFIKFIAWGQTAKYLTDYTSKGSLVLLEGELRIESYEKGGEKQTMAKVNVYKAEILSKSPKAIEQKQETKEEKPERDYYDEFGGLLQEEDKFLEEDLGFY